MLGTGTSYLDPDRVQSGILIEIEGESIRFDIGAGVFHRLTQLGVNLSSISSIFLSHFHVDHCSDFLMLCQSLWLSGHDKPLNIYGPPLIRQWFRGLFDIAFPYARDRLTINVTVLKEHEAVQVGEATISNVPTIHGNMETRALKIEWRDRSFVYSSDTDFTPFDKGAYASSTTYVSGAAVVQAANIVSERIKLRAALLLNASDPSTIKLEDQKATAPDGSSVTIEEIALSSLHHFDQEQIMGVSSFVAESSPPPFGAQFAEVSVDIETGKIHVDRLIMVVDSGRIVNPDAAFGQIEGGMIQAMGYAICEDMTIDNEGNPLQKDFYDYHILRSNEIPELKTIFVETQEPSHPFGVKAAAEIPMDGVAPAIGNAILDAIGVNINTLPITPEKVWTAINNKSD